MTEADFGIVASAARARAGADQLAEWLAFALALCDAADPIALRHFRRDLDVETKPDRSLVTAADRSIERLIRERIADRYPDHGVIGEEYGPEASGRDVVWHVDPIDGTHNFIRGVPVFASLIALQADGELQIGVISAPAMRERWYAARGAGAWNVVTDGRAAEAPRPIRASRVGELGSASLAYGSVAGIESGDRAPGFRDLLGDVWRERGFGDFWGYALVAEGAVDGMVEVGPKTWDLAAPLVVVEEAGGRLTDLDGDRRIDREEALASNGPLHEVLLAALRGG